MAPDIVHDVSLWTVRDNDGVVHRAVQQFSGNDCWIVTACDWWKTHNVSGQRAPIRVNEIPSCFHCVMYDIRKAAG